MAIISAIAVSTLWAGSFPLAYGLNQDDKFDCAKGIKEDVKEEDKEKDIRIKYVYVALRKLGGFWSFGANHWSVIAKLSNGQYVCMQKDDDGAHFYTMHNSKKEAVLKTWGNSSAKVRLSCYGSSDVSWKEFRNGLDNKSYYFIIFKDCQDFARGIVDQLTGKTVGVWPIEDGETFYP